MTALGPHAFVAPALDGPPTGGTIYNARLIAALRSAGVSCVHFELEALPADAGAQAGALWIDSLYLSAVPELRRRAGRARVHLLLHYLPSFVEHGRELERAELGAVERDALDAAQAVLVTSERMRRSVLRLGVGDRPVLCVEPGVDAAALHGSRERAYDGPTAAVMLCSVVPGKGVLALLRALAERASAADAFTLAVAGRLDAEPAYAAACAELVAREPRLAGRVRLLGALPHREALAALGRAHVLLSASRMEAYGMALAEARAMGVPILARRGGHAAAHVAETSGGELVDGEAELAERFLALVRDRTLLRDRVQKAQAGARARSWQQAAEDFIAQLA